MKLPNNIKLALARYYSNRRRSRELDIYNLTKALGVYGGYSMHGPPPPLYEWDKKADLLAIGAAASKRGFTFSASAGTFRFHRRKKTLQVNESNYLDDPPRV